MENKNQLIGLLAISFFKGIGPAFINKYVNNAHFLSSNIQDEIEDILTAANKKFNSEEVYFNIESAFKIYADSIDEGIKMVSILSEDYPEKLKFLKDAPPLLYLKGNLENLMNNTVCIIGTREPNPNGQKISNRVGKYFSDQKWSICNGLAEGVDTCSIKDDEKYFSNVIGVMAGGLNYNSRKTLLKSTAATAEKILANKGLLVSEMPINKKEDTFSVVKSCRIQAGLSNGLILIQSSLTGGSRYTVKSFAELNRPLAVILPFGHDIKLQSYEANIAIINDRKMGISQMTELKAEKIAVDSIHTIKSKEDYLRFEQAMFNSKIVLENKNSLF